MSKKIVVITGSPRKGGNSFAMTDAFVKAAEAQGYEVTRFDAAFMNVGAVTPARPVSVRARRALSTTTSTRLRLISRRQTA